MCKAITWQIETQLDVARKINKYFLPVTCAFRIKRNDRRRGAAPVTWRVSGGLCVRNAAQERQGDMKHMYLLIIKKEHGGEGELQ